MKKLRDAIGLFFDVKPERLAEWFAVPEPHESGVQHVHAILAVRLNEPELQIYRKDNRLRSGFVEDLFTGITSTTKLAGETFQMSWGSNVMAELVHDVDREISVSYLLKNFGERSPFHATRGRRAWIGCAHTDRLRLAARNLTLLQLAHNEISPTGAEARLKHSSAGWVGNAIWKSRGWTNISLKALQAERKAYATGQMPEQRTGSPLEWRYIGRATRACLTTRDDASVASLAAQEMKDTDLLRPRASDQERAHRTPALTVPWICIDTFVLKPLISSPTRLSISPHWVTVHGYSLGLGVG